MGTLRRSRTVRPEIVSPLKIQERDHWILESLGKMDFLTTSQLGELHFGSSVAAATKRMSKLYRAGYVRVWIPDQNLAAENVYSLDRKGAVLLGEPGQDRPRVPQGLDLQIEHRRLINEVRIRLALSLPEENGEIAWWVKDRDLAGRYREPVVPDALFVVRWPDAEQAFALEVEHQTKAAPRFLRKILRYQSFAGQGLYGLSELVTLVVAAEEKWRDRYRRALQKAYVGLPVFFAIAEAVQRSPLDAIWIGLTNDARYSLRNLPCRKETDTTVSTREAIVSGSLLKGHTKV